MLQLKNVSLRFGGPLLLDQVNVLIQRGERVCLLGRNGEGKSTLFKVFSGEQLPDSGEVILQSAAKIAQMPQEIPENISGNIFDIIQAGAPKVDEDSPEFWTQFAKIEAIIDQLNLEKNTDFNALSGGLKRRVLLGRALAGDPDILLLDEPTNHLDVGSIQFIENFLHNYHGTVIFITHDRAFLQRLATRILELDRGKLSSWACNYAQYLERKKEVLANESKLNAEFDKRLAQEEVWIRKGIEARRTRNMGRVARLYEMRKEFAERRNQTGKAQFEVNIANQSGKRVADLKNVVFNYEDKKIFNNINLSILRGEKIGIIGANGAGKTTLLNLILGKIQPHSGSIQLGTNLSVAWFDQLRQGIDSNKPVWHNVANGQEYVGEGEKRKHIFGYMQEFLFTPDRARQPTRVLSGGERARLLLAKLFSQPANILILDEPTNDLDIETLDLLEELITDFAGTVLLVSHDRAFLNQVATRTLVLDGTGQLGDYVGGYNEAMQQHPNFSDLWQARKNQSASQFIDDKNQHKTPVLENKDNKKQNKKSQKRLAELPNLIDKLEAKLAQLQSDLAESYANNAQNSAKLQAECEQKQTELSALYEEWEGLM